MSNLAAFLAKIWETGRAEVACDQRVGEGELASIADLLTQFEREYRMTLPAAAPSWDLAAAQWSALMLYRSCQCVVCRDIDAEEAVGLLNQPRAPSSASLDSHYSVDLLFRFLPDVVSRAGFLGEEDPILNVLYQWCRVWPLSSVGVSNVGEVDITAISASPCLMSMYVNRIIEKNDRARASQRLVQAKLRESAGEYVDLISEWVTDEQN